MVSLEALSPFKPNYISIDGHRMHYVDEGSGPPVVLLHGNPTWSYYFRNVIRALSKTHRCIAPDHIGCGLSDKPPESKYRYTLARRVEDLSALLERLGIHENISLVVHDWGGMIGLVYAVCHPDSMRRLVITNTAAFLLPDGKGLPIELRLCRLPMLGKWLVRGRNAFCRGAATRCTTKPLAAKSRAAYLTPYDTWEHRVAIHQFVVDIPVRPGSASYDLVASTAKSLERLAEVPSLLLWGKQDFVFDDDFLNEWRRRMPWAKCIEFAEAGHWLFEDEAEKTSSAVAEFLNQP